jgi:hypothetical protein
LADEKLNQIIFGLCGKPESQVFDDVKDWLRENIQKDFELLIQVH